MSAVLLKACDIRLGYPREGVGSRCWRSSTCSWRQVKS